VHHSGVLTRSSSCYGHDRGLTVLLTWVGWGRGGFKGPGNADNVWGDGVHSAGAYGRWVSLCPNNEGCGGGSEPDRRKEPRPKRGLFFGEDNARDHRKIIKSVE